jgi:hypothetical protein
MSGEALPPGVLASTQSEARFHLERTDRTVAKVHETLGLIERETFRGPIQDRMVEALATELQAVYTGFEAVVTRILKVKGLRFEKSGGHHAELLRAVEAQGVLKDEKMMGTFFDLLGFRHFIRNAYGVELRNEEVIGKAQNLCATWRSIEAALAAAIQELNIPRE